jgi:hypothetical protein
MSIRCKCNSEGRYYRIISFVSLLFLLASTGLVLNSSAKIECYNFENLTDINDFGYTDWSQTSPGYKSSNSIKSTVIGPGEMSSISKVVIGPANVSFRWKAQEYHTWKGNLPRPTSSVRTKIGEFTFLVDEEEVGLGGDADGLSWHPKEIELGEGEHNLEWRFKKESFEGGNIHKSTGAGWIDAVCIEYHRIIDIDLTSPPDKSLHYTNRSIDFVYHLEDKQRSLVNCVLYINGTEIEDFKYLFSKPGDYSWYVKCCDNEIQSQCYKSKERVISIKRDEPPSASLKLEGDINEFYIPQALNNVSVGFNYELFDDLELVESMFHITGPNNETETYSLDETQNYISLYFELLGNYTAYIKCVDNGSQIAYSENLEFFIGRDFPPIIKYVSSIDREYINASIENSTIIFENKSIEFYYEVEDDRAVEGCEIYIYENHNKINKQYSVSMDKFAYNFSNPGNYSWYIVCYDSIDQSNKSRSCKLELIPRLIIRDGDDIVKAVNISRDASIGYIIIKEGNYVLNTTLLLDYPLKLIGASRDKVVVFPSSMSQNNNLGINITSKDCVIQNISLMNFCNQINVTGNNTKIISNNFINFKNNDCMASIGIYAKDTFNLEINNNFFNTTRTDYKGCDLITDNVADGSIIANYFKGNISIGINASSNMSICYNDIDGIPRYNLKSIICENSRDLRIHNPNVDDDYNNYVKKNKCEIRPGCEIQI